MRRSALCLPLVLTVFAWGYNFIALKHLYLEVHPPAASLMRHILMYFMLVAVCAAWGIRPGAAGAPGKNWTAWIWGGWQVGFFGILSMGIYMIFFLEALDRTSAPEGAIVIATAPLFTMLFAILAKQEEFSWKVMAGALVAFSGVAMVVFTGKQLHLDHLLGNGLMLTSGMMWALSAVVSKPLIKNRAPIFLLTQSMPAAMVVLVPYALKDFVQTPWLDLSLGSYLSFGHFTALAGAFGFAGFFYGVQKIGATGAMYYQFCVAPLATVFAWIFLGDSLEPAQILGIGVVLAGVIWATQARKVREQARLALAECPAEA